MQDKGLNPSKLAQTESFSPIRLPPIQGLHEVQGFERTSAQECIYPSVAPVHGRKGTRHLERERLCTSQHCCCQPRHLKSHGQVKGMEEILVLLDTLSP